MKITPAVIMMAALLLAAGCAREQQQTQYDESISPAYSSGRMSDSASKSKSSSAAAYSTGAPANLASQKGASESDNTIVSQVRESLRRNAEIAPTVPNIQISANNGSVLLNGTVQSEEQKQQIGSMAQEATGVVAVNNQLKILSTPGGVENSPGISPLNPTSMGTNGSPRLYKDATNGVDDSTNSALNPTSLPGGASQIYQQSEPGEDQNAPKQNTNSNQMP